MEAAASKSLWIWHAFVGIPGSNNDLNILDRSPILQRISSGEMPLYSYFINDVQYMLPYLLADGIYPDWAIFLKTLSQPEGDAEKFFAKLQESIRKDVERAFGVLQAKWAIVGMPARLWSVETLSTILKCCIILHNMCVEDRIVEQGDSFEPESVVEALDAYDCGLHGGLEVRMAQFQHIHTIKASTFSAFVKRSNTIQDKDTYFKRRNDLIKHCWGRKGRQTELY